MTERPIKKKPAPSLATTIRVLPMELRLGDQLTCGRREYEVIGPPYTAQIGKNVHVRVKRVENAEVGMIRTSARKRIAVKRAS